MIFGKIGLIVGICLTGVMTVFHVSFPKLFGWKKNLERVSDANKRILFTIHLALLLLFLAITIVSAIHFNELTNPNGIGISFLVLIFLFWIWRAVWQIVYFKPEKGSKFGIMHYLLIVVFFLLAGSYIVPLVVKFLL